MPQIRLHVKQADGYLPAVCMSCGQPATTTTTKKMQWCPPWVGVLILAGLLPYAIVASILTRRATVQGPFCDEHKKHWFKRALLMWGSFFLFGVIGLGSIILVANLPRPHNEDIMPFVCTGSCVLLVVWLIIVIWAQNTGIRAKEITDDEILLDGVSAEFVDAVDEAEHERRERRAARRRERERPGNWRDEDDDADAPRRRRRPTTASRNDPANFLDCSNSAATTDSYLQCPFRGILMQLSRLCIGSVCLLLLGAVSAPAQTCPRRTSRKTTRASRTRSRCAMAFICSPSYTLPRTPRKPTRSS